jgi:hypothetical protein
MSRRDNINSMIDSVRSTTMGFFTDALTTSNHIFRQLSSILTNLILILTKNSQLSSILSKLR